MLQSISDSLAEWVKSPQFSVLCQGEYYFT